MTKLYLPLAFALCLYGNAQAQDPMSFQVPSQPILQLADYQRPPSTVMDRRRQTMLLLYRDTYKSLSDLAQEEMRLGGLRLNPRDYISATMSYVTGLKIKGLEEQQARGIKGLPAKLRMSYYSFSPDDQKLAFVHSSTKGLELWYIDLKTLQAKRIPTPQPLNASLGQPFVWTDDSQHLLLSLLPAKRLSLIDPASQLPQGPIISISDGQKAPNRTYQDLLKNPTDEHNFTALATSELWELDLKGKGKPWLPQAAIYEDWTLSPDGKYVLVSTVKRPFSYLVPYSRFANEQAVYDRKGKLVKLVNDVPLSESLPKGFMAVRTGKRNLMWRSDQAATLFFVEARDGGDPKKEADYRDELYLWPAPFDQAPRSFLRLQQRFQSILWGNDSLAIVSEYWYDTRNQKTFILDPRKDNTGQAVKIEDRNYQDVYSDPGNFAMELNAYGRSSLIVQDGYMLFRMGDGFSAEGKFPFVSSFDLRTQQTKILYRSQDKEMNESLMSFLDVKQGTVLCLRESKTQYPNYYIRYLKGDSLKPITFNQNPFAALDKVDKRLLQYRRQDGLSLSGTLYLPANYDGKSKLPLLIWAYPREYKDKNSAGQSTQTGNEFTFPSYGSFIYWVAKGYAVLDNAAFPIVGEGKTEPNDNFIQQLTWNAEAAIAAVDSLGYIDRKRVAVGGHSYGAFMTAHLLTHTQLFACGIARSGAYNRTLTPFGFQSEQRSYWDNPQLYYQISPFSYADKMKTPLLLVHGEADNNPGTFTLQTERYFQALKGHGAPVRMVILPKESHGYQAKENIMHLLWEQEQFLDQHLKP
jgi:dipeptidyl aminopeptidase/acylaminoacyl peptidase